MTSRPAMMLLLSLRICRGGDLLLPRIGLLSDSHGRAATTRRGVDLLVQEGVDLLLHLGDIGTVEVIDALAVNRPDDDTQLESRLVFGNTDWDQRSLAEYAEDLGVAVDDPMGRIALPDGVLAYCHGHREHDLEQAMAERVRYLCHGHTHRTLDTRRGPTRVINPGALFRASRYTVAVLDTERDELSFFPIGER